MCYNKPPVSRRRGSAACFRALSVPLLGEDEGRAQRGGRDGRGRGRGRPREGGAWCLNPGVRDPAASMEAPEWDPERSNGTFPPTLSPAVPPFVKLGLTVAYTVFYSLLFVFIYAQLWLVLRYRHKRFSYQTVFLFLCLLWASLRTVLFSFYFKDFVAANTLSPFAFWLLYCFPVCLQFFTLTLMNLYFTQYLLFQSNKKRSPVAVTQLLDNLHLDD